MFIRQFVTVVCEEDILRVTLFFYISFYSSAYVHFPLDLISKNFDSLLALSGTDVLGPKVSPNSRKICKKTCRDASFPRTLVAVQQRLIHPMIFHTFSYLQAYIVFVVCTWHAYVLVMCNMYSEFTSNDRRVDYYGFLSQLLSTGNMFRCLLAAHTPVPCFMYTGS